MRTQRGNGASLSWKTMGEWGLRLERAGSGRPVSQLWHLLLPGAQGRFWRACPWRVSHCSGHCVEWGLGGSRYQLSRRARSFWNLKGLGRRPKFSFSSAATILLGVLRSFLILVWSLLGCATLTASNFWFGISFKVISFLELSSH